jgi:hypothetical protein
MANTTRGEVQVRTGLLTDWTWAAVLWLFRVFCLAWLAVLVLLAVRGVAAFLER